VVHGVGQYREARACHSASQHVGWLLPGKTQLRARIAVIVRGEDRLITPPTILVRCPYPWRVLTLQTSSQSAPTASNLPMS